MVRVFDRPLMALLLTAAWVNSVDHAQAQPPLQRWQFGTNVQANGTIVQMPTNRPISRKNGLSLTVETRWVNNYGYRPIEFTFNALKPTTAVQLITVRMRAGGWSSQRGSITVEEDFEMLKGSTTATATIACPQYQLAVQYIWWEVWIDGVLDKDLSIDEVNAMTSMAGTVSPGTPAALSLLAVGPASQKRVLTSPTPDRFNVMALPVTDFPARWLDYTCLDVVMLSPAESRLLAQSNPNAFTALRRWVQAGGQLWIGDAGKDWERLPELSKLFDLAEQMAEVGEDRTEDEQVEEDKATAEANQPEGPPDRGQFDIPPETGWRPVRFGRHGEVGRVVTFIHLDTGMTQVARDPATIKRYQEDPNYAPTNQEFQPIEGGEPRRRWPRDSRGSFVDQPLGLGVVRAFRDDHSIILFTVPAPDDTTTEVDDANQGRSPPSVLEMALRSTRRWDSRHGMTPDDANADFAKLLVPGVGLAPVTEFRVLITLFVLLIGPVNYWVLKKLGRLQLFVLTVPLAAALMTTTLFAYAVLSDGFGTTVRAHSLTMLDQETGDAACWARLSYYSGLAPGQGLTMPSDVAIYPIIPGWNDTNIDANIGATREMLWEPEDAKLIRGWLRSRTPTQYLTVRARKSPYQLELASAEDKLHATNALGTTITYVVAVDEHGKLFSGENLPSGASTSLLPAKRLHAISRARQLIIENEPQPPPELAAEDSDFSLIEQRQARRMMSRRYGLKYSEQRLSANLMNDVLSEIAGLGSEPALQLPLRSYVAFTETGPEVELGIPGAVEEASFHVVVGHW